MTENTVEYYQEKYPMGIGQLFFDIVTFPGVMKYFPLR